MNPETRREADLLRAKLLMATMPFKIYLHFSDQELEDDKVEIIRLQKELYTTFPELRPNANPTGYKIGFEEDTKEDRQGIIRKLRLALGKEA